MPELNFAHFSLSRRLFYSLMILLVSLYPGQASWQLHPLSPSSTVSPIPTLPSLAPYPVSDNTPPPALTARAIVVQDSTSKVVLYAKNPTTLLLPASTTKIMTALVALDSYALGDTVTVAREDHALGSTMELVSGEQITVENLLYGLLVASGNDAAVTLADNYHGGYAGFVSAMNAYAHKLHLDQTVYKNPSGIDSPGHVTSARDLAILASVALQNPSLAKFVATKEITVTDTSGVISHQLTSTNELLGEVEGVAGIKTGWTESAGECLVTYVTRGDHALVIVVLNSADRFGETRALIDWAYNHHTWVDINP